MDGFLIVLAILLFSVFRNVIQEAQKKGDREDPHSFDTDSDQAEARERALESLRRWEAKQRRLPGGEETRGGEMRAREPTRIPRPGEHRTEVRLPAPRGRQEPESRPGPRRFEVKRSADAERTRREAYDAIRDLLAGQGHAAEPSLPAVRRQAQPAPVRRAAVPAAVPDSSLPTRPRVRGTLRHLAGTDEAETVREATGARPRTTAADTASRSPAGLGRLDNLPPVARGFLYAELLGRPVALREGDGPHGD